MSKMEMEAKKTMLQKMKKEMREKMHKGLPEKLKSAKKVVVESNSPEGLQEGLSVAQKILKGKLEAGASMKDMSEMMEDHDEEMEDDYKCGGTEKYMDGGVEDEEKKDESASDNMYKGFQGTKPFEKTKEEPKKKPLKSYYF